MQLGQSWSVDDKLIAGLEKFTCTLYGKIRCDGVNDLRYLFMKKRCGNDLEITPSTNVNLAIFPPCLAVLVQHILRVNFQVRIWNIAVVRCPEVPSPAENHGWVTVNGKLEPLWVTGNVLPMHLADILEETTDESEALEDEEDNDIEYDNVLDMDDDSDNDSDNDQ